MQYLMLALCFLSFSSMAYEDVLKVDDFSVQYEGSKGSGSTAGIQVDDWVREGFEFELLKKGKVFVLRTEGNEYQASQLPAFLLEVSNFKIQRLNFHNQQKDYKLDMSWFSYATPKENASFQTAKLHCVNGDVPDDYTSGEKILSACILNSDVSIKRIRTVVHKESNSIERALAKAIMAVNDQESRTTIEDLKIRIRNHNVKLTMVLKAFISAGVEIRGHSIYEKAKTRVRFRIDYAKASFFNIKRRLFAELAKDKTGFVTVKKPYVYFNF